MRLGVEEHKGKTHMKDRVSDVCACASVCVFGAQTGESQGIEGANCPWLAHRPQAPSASRPLPTRCSNLYAASITTTPPSAPPIYTAAVLRASFPCAL